MWDFEYEGQKFTYGTLEGGEVNFDPKNNVVSGSYEDFQDLTFDFAVEATGKYSVKEIYEEFLYRVESLTACDYSAAQKMSQLYKLFFRILNDWGSDIVKQPIKSVNKVHKEWAKHRKTKIKDVLKIANSAITKKDNSLRDHATQKMQARHRR